MSMYGANPEQLAHLGRTLTRQIEAIQQVLSSVDGVLGGTTWQGPARERFQQEWNGAFKQALGKLYTQRRIRFCQPGIQLLDAMGREVPVRITHAGHRTMQVDHRGAPAGVYHLRIGGPGGQVERVVIEQ